MRTKKMARCGNMVLVKRGNRYAIIYHDERRTPARVKSIEPISGGGVRHAGWSDEGVNYVAVWRSKDSATKRFRERCLIQRGER